MHHTRIYTHKCISMAKRREHVYDVENRVVEGEDVLAPAKPLTSDTEFHTGASNAGDYYALETYVMAHAP